jgi:hypothetical protein
MYGNIVNLDINNNISEFIKSHPLYPYIKLYEYKELDEVNTKIPTLYIGYRANKERVPTIEIGDTFITETERWAFTPQESAIFFIEQCTTFLQDIPAMLVHALVPVAVEPIFGDYKTYMDVETAVVAFDPTVCYIFNDVFCLSNSGNKVMIINGGLWEAFNMGLGAILHIILNHGKARIVNDDDARIRLFFMEVFDYKPEMINLYAPYLIALKDKATK